MSDKKSCQNRFQITPRKLLPILDDFEDGEETEEEEEGFHREKYFFLFFNCHEISGVNFTNILRAQKLLIDPKSAKKTVKLSRFFALLGSASVKAARRTLVKLNPIEPY